MSWFGIVPRDTVLLRDGRPFGATPGARAYSFAFPVPSTVAGAIRSRLGMNHDGAFDHDLLPEVLQSEVHGPLLVRLAEESGRVSAADVHVPAPLDVLLTGEGEGPDRRIITLRPSKLVEGEGCDLPVGLLPLIPAEGLRGKTSAEDAFWSWGETLKNLEDAAGGVSTYGEEGKRPGPLRETRVQIGLDGNSGTAREQHLFSTTRLRFDLGQDRLGILVRVKAEGEMVRRLPGLGTFGGERGLAWYQPVEVEGLTPPEKLVNAIAVRGRLRVQMLTPAKFSRGWQPGAYLTSGGLGGDPRLRLVAARVERTLVVSGWDLARNRPKPTFRCAPSGSVYFYEVDGGVDAAEVASRLWLRPVSDAEEDRRSGFGLAVVGPWDYLEGES